MPITEQQKAVCREYLKDFNITQAMVRVGYSRKTADKKGYLFLKNPEVAFYLKELMDKQQANSGLTAQRVLDELERMAFSNHLEFYKWSEKKRVYVLKAPEELTPSQQAAVKSYTPGKGYELYSKDSALDKLAKYFKLYSEIEATVTNFVLMPELKLNGKTMVFDIGKPAPKRPVKEKV